MHRPEAPLLVMAPEATTKAAHCLLKFRRGAFSPGQAVCPMLLTYATPGFNPGWGIVPSTPLHVLRMLCQPVNRVRLQVLPPIPPRPEERDDPLLFAARVRAIMAKALQCPLVEQVRGVGGSGVRGVGRAPVAGHRCRSCRPNGLGLTPTHSAPSPTGAGPGSFSAIATDLPSSLVRARNRASRRRGCSATAA